MDAPDAVVITARLPKDLGDWVNEEFGRGFKQKFMHQCFDNLRHVLTHGELPPQSEYARAASIKSIERMAGNASASHQGSTVDVRPPNGERYRTQDRYAGAG
jgi:hypothetical protein